MAMPRGNVPGWGLPTAQGTPSTQLPSLRTRLVKDAQLVRGCTGHQQCRKLMSICGSYLLMLMGFSY